MRARTIDIHGATLSRRQFVKAGGTLVVGFGLVGRRAWAQPSGGAVARNSLDPSKYTSWCEIHADNTILIRTGRVDFGQSTVTTSYRQIVAEELSVPYEAITTVVQGDTDRTPDGGPSAGFLNGGGQNLRKAAAYTYQALLDVAATTFGVDKSQLSVTNGVVSGGGRRMTYGELVRGQELKLTIPVSGDLTTFRGLTVTGNPPLKPTSQYAVIGKSFANAVTDDKVRGAELWVTDVRLPQMLHGRVVHPKTLGSTLQKVGALDKKQFPNAQVIVRGNLVGVVAPTEWEAITAAESLESTTQWSEWKGLPGHASLARYLRTQADWTTTPVIDGAGSGDTGVAFANAARTFAGSYDLPYMKHAPIGPAVAVGDVRADGTVYVHTRSQNPQALRGQIAMMLGTPVDNVIVRVYAGSGHYGRSNGGNAGAEDEAVILSKAVGRPVRVQWTRADDMTWSTQSPPGFSDVRLALDANGVVIGYEADHHMPAMQDDRLVGAVLAGLPTQPPPPVGRAPIFSTGNFISDPWVYTAVPNVRERGRGALQVGEKASPLAVGLRDHSMRTPGQLQQNVPRELAFSEAAAAIGMDPLEFRIRQTKEPRLVGVLKAVQQASGWESRPAPRRGARATGSEPLVGQGVSVVMRANTYWACVCQITVVPATGKVTVTKYTVALDPGIVINPVQLKRQVQGGALMGLCHALYEEVEFDEGAVTSRDWGTYPILTMADVPEVEVVIIDNPGVGSYGGASEAANALAMSAVGAAFFDATGKPARRMPLRPDHVKAMLQV
jgi:nicotinate dehydrogenase subunit B